MMKKIATLLLFISIGYSYAQPAIKTMKRLPDTGQTTSYTTTFGEDADYLRNAPGYQLNAYGTVTDTVTGLMWQKTDGGEMTIEQAIAYCDTLSLAGYTNWRLPDCHELFSILQEDRVNPAIDTAYFTLTSADYWWSSERQANDSNKVWATNAGGGVGNHPKTETISAGGNKRFHVRAVRDVQLPQHLGSRFTPYPDGSIMDSMTELIWQSIPAGDSITWESALHYADTLSYAGFTDWRLPNIKELQSISQENRINPSVDPGFFPGIKVGHYWSGTSLPNQTQRAWYLDTRFGITTYADKTSKQLVICVRDATTISGIIADATNSLNLSVSPNPAGNELWIRWTDADNITVSLFNLQGEDVKCSMEYLYHGIHLDVTPLANGYYILRAAGLYRSSYAKIVIAR